MTSDRLAMAIRRALKFEYEGAFFEAEQIFKQLLRQRSGIEMVHYEYAQFLLRKGDYAEAWPHFMKRLDDAVYREREAARLKQPYWDATDPSADAGRTILVYADQGIGDMLMCARFLPQLAARFERTVFVVFPGFRELMSTMPFDVEVIEFGDPLPDFDVHADLFSVPALLGTTPDTIPPPECLSADPARVQAWRAKLDPARFNVGLSWQGNPVQARNAERSQQLEDLYPLLRTGAAFHCLQVGDAVAEAAALPDGMNVAVYPEITESVHAETGKMLETAALASCMDLVISVDTAVAHLAGALGLPLWIPLAKVADWRYAMDVEFSPWYPDARLFRAHERYDWTRPMHEMSARLSELVAEKQAGSVPSP